MFRGTFEHTIDDKGRVNVPVRFRELLLAWDDTRLVITNFSVQGVHCLDVYPYPAWLRLEERLRQIPQFDPNAVAFFQNYYTAGAHECQLDKQGRILVPPRLRDYAGLKRDVIFTGALEKFRIWDRDAWWPVFAGGEDILNRNPAALSTFGV